MQQADSNDDIALQLLRTALAQLELAGRDLPAVFVRGAVDAIERETWRKAGVQTLHGSLQ